MLPFRKSLKNVLTIVLLLLLMLLLFVSIHFSTFIVILLPFKSLLKPTGEIFFNVIYIS
jgi:hypothetical protein